MTVPGSSFPVQVAGEEERSRWAAERATAKAVARLAAGQQVAAAQEVEGPALSP